MYERSEENRQRKYRTAMKGLQPHATEASALRMAGWLRGLDMIVPGMLAGRPSRANVRRDW
jgi:hypothetical protein